MFFPFFIINIKCDVLGSHLMCQFYSSFLVVDYSDMKFCFFLVIYPALFMSIRINLSLLSV